MKRLLAVLLSCLMLPAASLPVSAEVPQNWVLSNNVLTIEGSGALRAGSWQVHADKIFTVVIEEGITEIPAGVLYELPNLQTIELPQSLTVLAPHALEGNPALAEITGLENVTSFGYHCLSGTACMEQMPFVITDGRLYYAECTDLNVPDGVTEIMPYAFGNLTDAQFLQSPVHVTLPQSVTAIGENAFAFCTSLTEITLPAELQSIGDHAFYNCARLQSLTLPRTVKTVGEQAFFNCRSLAFLTSPNPQTVFGADAFGICYDWEEAIHSRRESYPDALHYQQALAELETAPCSMDDAMTRFALHSPDDRSYDEISYSQGLTVPYLRRSGTLRAYAGTQAQTYASSAAVGFEPLAVLQGDVNSDGSVDILDVILFNKFLIGVSDLTAPARTAADLNADEDLTSGDALSILKLCLI